MLDPCGTVAKRVGLDLWVWSSSGCKIELLIWYKLQQCFAVDGGDGLMLSMSSEDVVMRRLGRGGRWRWWSRQQARRRVAVLSQSTKISCLTRETTREKPRGALGLYAGDVARQLGLVQVLGAQLGTGTREGDLGAWWWLSQLSWCWVEKE